MIQSTLRYDRPIWEGLKISFKLSLVGECPRRRFFKILFGSAHRKKKPILQLARELESLTAADHTQASPDDMAAVHRLLRKMSRLLDAYEMAFGQDFFWDEVMGYVGNRLERYFYHDPDSTDILSEIDAQDETVRPWDLADYQLFGIEPPPYLPPK